ncbi:MAG: PH domain-containing protein [Planctomycetota bacterium]
MADEERNEVTQAAAPGGHAGEPADLVGDVRDTRPRDRAIEAGFPPDSGPEQPVRSVHASMARAAPLRFGLLSVLFIGGVIAAPILYFQNGGFWPTSLAVVLAISVLVSLGWLVWWKIETFGHELKITNKRTTVRVGIFSKRTSEVLHDNIRNVRINQNFWQRVWNIGELGISSAGQDDIEVTMEDVPDPHELARIIDLYRPLG